MKPLAIFLLAAASALALDNSRTITNNLTGTALTNYPIWFGAWFKEGEITGYPRAFATPSDTGTRAAITTWQADVKNRWRDSTSVRTVTGARIGASGKTWSSGGGGLTSIVIATVSSVVGVGTITFTSDVSSLISVGDRLVITGTGSNMPNAPANVDNITVTEVSTTVVRFLSRGNRNGTYQTAITYNTPFQVAQQLDPMEGTTSCRFTSANHDLYKGETITFPSVTFGTLTMSSATQIVTGVTRNEFVTNATCSGSFSTNGSATGPANGSVKFALVSMITTIPADGSTRIDFINSTNPSSAGDAAATATAGFSKSEMLAFQPDGANDWNGTITATADVKSGATAAITTSARALLTAWNGTVQSYCGPRYWANGPVLTWLILEYGCPAEIGATISSDGAYQTDLPTDFGWKIRPGSTLTQAIAAGDTEFTVTSVADLDVNTVLWIAKATGTSPEHMLVVGVNASGSWTGSAGSCTAPCIKVTRGYESTTATNYVNTQSFGVFEWEDATAPYKSLHPAFHLKFLGGSWPGVGVLAEVKNDYWDKIQNLWYSAILKTGPTPSARITTSTFKHLHNTNWKLSTWDGTDPEFACSDGDPDPENCVGSSRKRKFIINHNTAYLGYSYAIPSYKLFASAGGLPEQTTGFSGSGKGAIGTSLSGGTWGRDNLSSATAPNKDFATVQEANTFPSWQAMCFLTWSESCYENNFGDTVPGGAGNVEGQMHIPWMHRIADAVTRRIVMPGFAATGDLAFGRTPSLYSMPTQALSLSDTSTQVAVHDKPNTACSSAAPIVIPAASTTSGTGTWPCFWTNIIGEMHSTQWAFDRTHINEWCEFPYLITGDPRYLACILNSGSYAAGLYTGVSPNADRLIGRSWAQPIQAGNSSVEARTQGVTTRGILNAAIYAPNVAQFGYTVPDVWAYYFNEKSWDLGLGMEGVQGDTTGYFFQMYPHAVSSCATSSTTSIWWYVHCSLAGGWSNALGWSTYTPGTTQCTTDWTWLNCPSYYAMGMFHLHHQQVQYERAERQGLQAFHYPRRTWGNTVLSWWGSANWNYRLNDLDFLPARRTSTGFIETLSDMYTLGMKASWSPTGPNGAFSRDDQTWYHDCGSKGRCANADTHSSYLTQFRAMLASLSDLDPGSRDGCGDSTRTPNGCTWANAWNRHTSTAPSQNTYNNLNKFVFEPRSYINDLVCTPAATTAICTFTAPTNDPGTYAISTATFTGTSTIDTADTAVPCAGRRCRFIITGRTEATQYFVRVTAGQRVSGFGSGGTGRAFTNFTTLTEGAASSIPVTAKATGAATTATVDYGPTTGVAGGTLGPTTCTSPCAFDIPGNAYALVYYRVTYKTGGGTTISQGAPQPVVIPPGGVASGQSWGNVDSSIWASITSGTWATIVP